MSRVFIAVALACISSLATAAHAQDSRTEARTIFEEAARQFEAGNHQLALDGFTRSRELMAGDERASALILFNIARSQEELGREREALASFEQFLMESPADAPYREETQDRVRELRARLAATAEESGPVAPAESSPLPLVGGIVLGVGALTALAALPTGILALDGTAQLEAACPGGACPDSEASRIDETHMLGVLTDVLWVSGLVVAAAGATLMILGLASGDDDSETASLIPTFFCTGDACIGGVAGRL